MCIDFQYLNKYNYVNTYTIMLYIGKVVGIMPTNKKQTSAKAASAASKVLRDGRTSKNSKTAAGSALAQTPSKKKK